MARFRQVGSAGSLSGYPQSRHLTGAFMATTATARSEPDLYGRIAAPLHTILVLAAQGALVVRGVIRADQARAMASMNRMTMYERTILSEWLMFALVILGVWLHGSSLLTVLGERSHGNSAFRSGVWSSALLPGAWRGGSDRIARRAAGDSGQLAKKRASGNDCPRVGRYFRWSACPFDEDQSRLTAVG